MAGNSKRRGAVRKAAKHTAGSGGRVRQGLEGRGPTPKAEDREYHPAHQRKVAAETRAATGRPGSSGTAPRRPARRSTTQVPRPFVPSWGSSQSAPCQRPAWRNSRFNVGSVIVERIVASASARITA